MPSSHAASPVRDGGEEPARKLIRPSLDGRRQRMANGTTRRREAPPDATGAEAALLSKLGSMGAIVELRLQTGDVLSGKLEWADRSCVKLRKAEGTSVLVMKQAIVSLTGAGTRRG